jgi:hypothetical protein
MPINWTNLQKKYKGLWVALSKDEKKDEKTVLGSGKTVKDALNKARERSNQTPFLTRVPEKIITFVVKQEPFLLTFLAYFFRTLDVR